METHSACSRVLQKTAGIGIIYANVRGLRSKLEDVHLIVETCSPEIIALSETWLTPEVLDSEIQLTGYLVTRVDRLGNRAGKGVLLYSKESMELQILEAVHDEGRSVAE